MNNKKLRKGLKKLGAKCIHAFGVFLMVLQTFAMPLSYGVLLSPSRAIAADEDPVVNETPAAPAETASVVQAEEEIAAEPATTETETTTTPTVEANIPEETIDTPPAGTEEVTGTIDPEAASIVAPDETPAVTPETVQPTENTIPAVTESVDNPAPAVNDKICLDDNAEIKTSQDSDWNVDGQNKAETKEKVKLGVKYEFPLNKEVSVTFTCLPTDENKLSTLKIEQIATDKIDLPNGMISVLPYLYDITTKMDNGDFEYTLTLPEPKNSYSNIEMISIDKTFNELNDGEVKNNDIDVIENKKTDEEKNIIKAENLDHLSIKGLATTTSGWPNCGFQCQAGDTYVTEFKLVDFSGNPLTSCTPGLTVDAYINASVYNNSNSDRKAVILLGDVYEGINLLEHFNTGGVDGVCVGDTVPAKGTLSGNIYHFSWTCGQFVTIKNLVLSWDTGNATCSDFFSDPACSNRTTKCYSGTSFDVTTPLVANFSASDVCLGTLTNFTDSTTGGLSPYAFSWLFGDSGTSTLQNPSHLYASASSYNVTETVTDSKSATDSESKIVNVWAKPSVDFSAFGSTCPDMSVTFSNNSTAGSPNGGSISGYLWNFGDSHTSTDASPTHSYATPGNYTVTLTANDGHSCSNFTQKPITVGACGGTLNVVKTLIKDNDGTANCQDFSFKVNGGNTVNFENDCSNSIHVDAGTYNIVENSASGYTTTYDNCSNVNVSNGGSATCTIINNDQPGTLIVKKTVINDNGGTKTASNFSFSINGGGATAFEADGQNDLTVNAGTYNITEPSVAGYSTTYDNCSGVVIPNGGSATCTITNNDIQPKLTVTKAVTNNNGGTKVISDFPLFVGATSVTSGAQNGFNAGSYTVSETTQAGYTGTISGDCASNGNITLNVGDAKTCTITNDDIAPTLTLVKTVTNDNGGNKQVSDFTLKIDGITVTSGVAKTLLAGNHTASEINLPGYTASSWGQDCAANGMITLAPGDNKTCTITNDDQSGTLIVKKTVINDDGGAKIASDFSFSVNGGAAAAFEADGQNDLTVNAGTYNVTEPAVAGYTTTYNNCSNVSIPNGGTATCTITNDDQPGTLIVKKVVEGGTKTCTDFSFSYNPTGAIPFEADCENQITVNAGTYNITEPAVDGYTASYNNCSGVVVSNGETETCTITNTRDTGQLKAIKTIDDGTALTQWSFKLNDGGWITANASGEVDFGQVLTLTNHTIYEKGPDGYHLGSVSCTNTYTDNHDGSATTVVSKNGTTTCTFNNNVDKGTITIVKEASPKDAQDFSFTTTGTGLSGFSLDDDADGTLSNSTTFSSLFPGSYSVTENSISGWDLTNLSCTENGGQSSENSTTDKNARKATLTLEAGENITCVFTNTKRGHIIVEKNAIPDDNVQGFVFQNNFGNGNPSTFTLTDTTASGLPSFNAEVLPGIYSVSENATAGWKLSNISCTDGADPQSISVVAGQTKTCTFTNRKLGTITLVKNTLGGDGSFDFNMTGNSLPGGAQIATSGNAGSQTFNGIDPENTYSISEVVPAGWNLTSATCTRGTPASFNIIATELNVTCTFTNTKKGHLIVQKTTAPTGDQTSFTINASGTGTITGGGAGTITDANDKDYEVTPGTYSVAETVPAGWAKTGDTCQNVVVGAGETKTCLITNAKCGSITVVKNMVGATGTFAFTGDIAGNISANNGQLTHSNLLPGSYLVQELAAPGWDLTNISCDDGTNGGTASTWDISRREARYYLDAGENIICTFTNTKKPTLTVNKVTVPSTDSGLFNLQIDSVTKAANVGNSGTTGAVEVTIGSHTVGEIAGGETVLSEYAPVIGGECAADGSITLAAGDNKTCTITNTRKPKLTIVKVTDPTLDTGKFNLFINSTQYATNVGNGGTTNARYANIGANTFAEATGTSTNLSDYTSVVSGTGCGGTATAGTITLAAGDNKTCTITNTKKGHITIKKVTVGGDDNFTFTGDVAGSLSNNQTATVQVVPGTYHSTETILTGWDLTSINCDDTDSSGVIGTGIATFVVAAGEDVTCTFTNTQRGSISGYKYEDMNGNGVWDQGEPAVDGATILGGLTIFVDINSDGVQDIGEARTDIDGNGYYSFDNLVPGQYSVCERDDQLTGWLRTDPSGSRCQPVTVNPGQNTADIDFGNFKLGSISGQKWNDLDGDGIKNAGEPGIPGWTINLDKNADSSVDATVTTDANGNYSFTGLTAGTYRLREVGQTGWAQTTTDPADTVIQSGSDVTNVDFGNQGRGTITVVKNTVGGDDTFGFGTIGGLNPQTFDITTSGGTGNRIYTDVPAGNYNVFENLKTGWDLTDANCVANGDPGNSFDPRADVFILSAGDSIVCTFTNTFIIPELKIDKLNNATGNKSPGDSVTYTLTIKAAGGEEGEIPNQSDVKDVEVTDLPPAGFEYRSGSWTANSSVRGDIKNSPTTEPTYHSPGVWKLGDMAPGEIVTLTYIADISSGQDSGLYRDLAWTEGIDLLGNQVLGTYGDPEYFVGTQVAVVRPVSASVEIPETTETHTTTKHKTKEVLGAAIILPATGANAIWVIIAAALLLAGLALTILGRRKNKQNNFSAQTPMKVLITLIFASALILGLANASQAGVIDDLSVKIEQPKSPSNNDFLIGFVALDIQGKDMTVDCYKKGPSDAAFSIFDTVNLIAGGTSGDCVVDPAVAPVDGNYDFFARATASDSRLANSDTVSVDIVIQGPGTPVNYNKDKLSSCENKISFTTADDSGRTVRAEIYRSTDTAFVADDSTRVANITGLTSNQDVSYTDTVPDCSLKYYYVARAFDAADNGSGFVGDEEVNVEHRTRTKTTTRTIHPTVTTAGAIPVTGGGAVGGAEIGGEAQPGAGEEGQVLGEEMETQGQAVASWFAKNKWPLIIIIIVILLAIYGYRRRNKSEKSV